MTDPPPPFSAENVTLEKLTTRKLVAPAISRDSVSYSAGSRPTSRVTAAQNQSVLTEAYASNLFAASGVDISLFTSGSETHSPHIADSPYLAHSPDEIARYEDQAPILGTFGSRDWVPPVVPYLEFAPQPVYEPTGELAREQIDTFDEFPSPPLRRLPYTSISSTNSIPTITTEPPTNLAPTVVFKEPALPPKSALKRKADAGPISASHTNPTKRQESIESVLAPARTVSFSRMSDPSQSPTGGGTTSPDVTTGEANPRSGSSNKGRTGPGQGEKGSSPRTSAKTSSGAPRQSGRGIIYKGKPTAIPILPAEKVFPIQIGSELFRLSGASITSDAPSYFTQFFEEQIRQNEESGGVRTLYIDRDPVTFRDVARHLQGYYIKPTDGSHFVKLFADAQFYSLPRLIEQLFESEIFIQIGDRHFQIPKDIFSAPGDSPNFFSLGFAVFFSTPGEVFPGLDRKGLLRPPSIVPPSVPNRSSKVFAELLHLLRGYPLHIRNEDHRAELLRDCRYFHLRGLEQRIIAHEISYNLERQRSEICLRLEDVKPSGVSFVNDVRPSDSAATCGWVNYARPFVDDTSYELILEIGGESTILDLDEMRADFHGLAKARVSSLFQVIANKMNLPTNAPLGLMMLSGGQSAQPASPGHTPLSEDRVKVRIERTADVTLDGQPYEIDWAGLHPLSQARPAGSTASEAESEAMSETMSAPGRVSQTSSGGVVPRQSTSDTAPTRGQSRLAVPPHPTSRLSSSASAQKKRKRQGSLENAGEWIVRGGQWRLRVQPIPNDPIRGGLEIVFVAVKMDAYTEERARNARRSFLS